MPTAATAHPLTLIARAGLAGMQKSLPPWLFYDDLGSELFEQITELPEYYLTRTERSLLVQHSEAILAESPEPLTIVELGAGTAKKTGVLLAACLQRQSRLLYQPIDISPSALELAESTLGDALPRLAVRAQVANYITDPYQVEREPGSGVLAMYIGSSIGNFSPEQAREILANLRGQLRLGDRLLLGTDLAPGASKSLSALLAAYDDAQGVTAAFNRNMLAHLNREIGTNFDPDRFSHEARWNAEQSRIEMHLVSRGEQTVQLDGQPVHFRAGESIHTENSYKFTAATVRELLSAAGYAVLRSFEDEEHFYALTLAEAV